ncbi:YggS family pyridoxal phosphate-dependent enzyme [Legionella septentrionalis]|uniref:YggS family pyridoxal phosphate-dependent enzyme n=1 Tax=Legionella septentrionalis TaxID=2498109 RepID=UPI000F8C5492|nr:YggS family pyridoxal phosphate-dependent enzyme [Legionella septentrionalis]RUQ99980.1 YggS family pyridoxal phosphate-dependent enzyme [Legionella septentrionalis]
MTIAERIQIIKACIHQAEQAGNREPGAVKLLAVSKSHPTAAIAEAYTAGIRDFGENYLQEAQLKIKQLAHLPISWHFIGPIQSNKVKGIASQFSWVHSLCRYEIAEALNNLRPPHLPPLNICLQVNFDDEKKSGIKPEMAHTLAAQVFNLPRLTLRGLMMIPKPLQTHEQQYASFMRLTHLRHELNEQLHVQLDTLSMGMSDDLCAAIEAGSTLVRIGRAIFGERR